MALFNFSNSLVISGQRICPQYDSQTESLHIERGCGYFSRRVRVPEGTKSQYFNTLGTNSDAVSASFTNGVLSVTIQKPSPPTVAIEDWKK